MSLAITVLLARALGPAGYGTYAFVLAIVSLLGIPAQGGLPQLVVRETARGRANGEWGLVKGLWRWATTTSAALSLMAALLAGAVFLFVRNGASSSFGTTLLWGLALVPLVALGNLRGAAVRGMGRVVLGQVPELLVRPVLFLTLLALLVTRSESLDPASAMTAHVVAAGTAFLVGALMLLYVVPSAVGQARPSRDGKRWVASALPLAFIAGMHLLNANTDIVMLGLLATDEEVGIYRVAVTGSTVVAFGLQAVNMVVSPEMARFHAAGDIAALQRLARTGARLALSIAIPATVLLAAFGGPLLALLFGEDFREGALALTILAVGQSINALFGSVAALLNMTGHERTTARSIGQAALVNVGLNLVLIPAFGMVGAAAATVATFAFWNALLWRAVRVRLGVNSLPFSRVSTRPLDSRPGDGG